MLTESGSSFGDRMKQYEMAYAGEKIATDHHICVRLDGKNFSNFTRKLVKPFDSRLTDAMVTTMNHLVKTANAKLGYTQSDEISLWIPIPEFEGTEVYHCGRIQKICSLLASEATIVFNTWLQDAVPEYKDRFARFDCRVWGLPDKEHVADAFKWRMMDCVRNSVSMASHHLLGHSKNMHKNTDQKIQMIRDAGSDWHQNEDRHKFGIFAETVKELTPIPEDLKHFPSNQGKENYMRSTIKNFVLSSFNDIYFTLGVQNEKIK